MAILSPFRISMPCVEWELERPWSGGTQPCCSDAARERDAASAAAAASFEWTGGVNALMSSSVWRASASSSTGGWSFSCDSSLSLSSPQAKPASLRAFSSQVNNFLLATSDKITITTGSRKRASQSTALSLFPHCATIFRAPQPSLDYISFAHWLLLTGSMAIAVAIAAAFGIASQQRQPGTNQKPFPFPSLPLICTCLSAECWRWRWGGGVVGVSK